MNTAPTTNEFIAAAAKVVCGMLALAAFVHVNPGKLFSEETSKLPTRIVNSVKAVMGSEPTLNDAALADMRQCRSVVAPLLGYSSGYDVSADVLCGCVVDVRAKWKLQGHRPTEDDKARVMLVCDEVALRNIVDRISVNVASY